MVSFFNSNTETIWNWWDSASTFFSSKENHQPILATFSTLSIISKAAYKAACEPLKSKNIKKINGRFEFLKKIQKKRGFSNYQNRTLSYLLQKEEIDQFHIRVALMQLISLNFPNPGSNLWNSSITLLGRAASIHHYFKNADRDSANIMHGTLGCFSALGTGISFLSQASLISQHDTPISRALNWISLAAMSLEIGLAIKGRFFKQSRQAN